MRFCVRVVEIGEVKISCDAILDVCSGKSDVFESM